MDANEYYKWDHWWPKNNALVASKSFFGGYKNPSLMVAKGLLWWLAKILLQSTRVVATKSFFGGCKSTHW